MELANGIYRARVTQWALGKTDKGNEQVVMEFDFLDDGFVGTRMSWYGYFTEKGLPITLKALRTCGWHGSDLADLSGVEINEVSLTVENETYEGKTRPKIKWVNAVGGFNLKAPLAADEAKAFGARMKGAVLAFDKSEGKPAPKPNAKPKGTSITDDIPF
jgi:hypothetical protein